MFKALRNGSALEEDSMSVSKFKPTQPKGRKKGKKTKNSKQSSENPLENLHSTISTFRSVADGKALTGDHMASKLSKTVVKSKKSMSTFSADSNGLEIVDMLSRYNKNKNLNISYFMLP